MMPKIGYKLIAGAVALALVLFIVFGGFSYLSGLFSAKTALRVEEGQHKAFTKSGVEAGNTLTAVIDNAQATDETIDNGIAAVRALPESQRGRETQRQACQTATYRDTPKCKALK